MRRLPDCLTRPVDFLPAEGDLSQWVEVLAFRPGSSARRGSRGWIKRCDMETGVYMGWRFVALRDADKPLL